MRQISKLLGSGTTDLRMIRTALEATARLSIDALINCVCLRRLQLCLQTHAPQALAQCNFKPTRYPGLVRHRACCVPVRCYSGAIPSRTDRNQLYLNTFLQCTHRSLLQADGDRTLKAHPISIARAMFVFSNATGLFLSPSDAGCRLARRRVGRISEVTPSKSPRDKSGQS